MLNGFRILLLIVVLIGIVLISGYTQLMFGKDSEKTSSTINGPLSYSVPMITKTQPSQNVYSRQKTEKDQNTEESVQKTGYTDVAKILETNQNTEEDRKLPSMKNRTAEARNDNIVIFNRVPKTGSEMFQAFTKHLGSIYGYHVYVDPQIMTLFPSKQDDYDFTMKFQQEVNDSGVYFRHMTYFDFPEKQRPIYISMVRHPVDRMASWFYYRRWQDRPDDENPKNVCAKNPQWETFCAKMEAIRGQDLQQTTQWYNLTFDQCVDEAKLPDCIFHTGNGYLLQKDFAMDFRSQMMFFCGNNLECSLFNSDKVLNMAKENVEKKYSVVGILEDLESTWSVIEALVPKFFRKAKRIFKEKKDNLTLTHTNRNPFKKSMSNETRNFLNTKFNVEIEFYEFCKQRLYKQLKGLEEDLADFETEDMEWPDQLAQNEIVPVDDYVLL